MMPQFHPQVEGKTFLVTHLTRSYVEASYGNESVGVRFTSSTGNLTVSSLNGEILVTAHTSHNGGYRYEIVSLLGKYFMRDESLGDVPVTRRFAEYVQSTGNAERTFIQRQLLLSFSRNSDEKISDAVNRILQRPECQLLQQAAQQLSQQNSGHVNGKDYPGTLPFFMFASRVIEAKQRVMSPLLEQSKLLRKRRNNVNVKDDDDDDDYDDDCLDDCPPCEEEGCLGMCGVRCMCWDFVCGDCCYHVGCYDHTVCCRMNYFSIACMFPIYFSCEDNYYCSV